MQLSADDGSRGSDQTDLSSDRGDILSTNIVNQSTRLAGIKRKSRFDARVEVEASDQLDQEVQAVNEPIHVDPPSSANELVYMYTPVNSYIPLLDFRLELAMARNLVFARTQSKQPSVASKSAYSDMNTRRKVKHVPVDKDSFSELNYVKRFACYDWMKLDASCFQSTALSDTLLCNGTKGLGAKKEENQTRGNRKPTHDTNRKGGARSDEAEKRCSDTRNSVKRENPIRLPPACHLEKCYVVLLSNVFVHGADLTTVLLRCVAFGDVKHFVVHEDVSAIASFLDVQCARACATALRGELFLRNTLRDVSL